MAGASSDHLINHVGFKIKGAAAGNYKCYLTGNQLVGIRNGPFTPVLDVDSVSVIVNGFDADQARILLTPLSTPEEIAEFKNILLYPDYDGSGVNTSVQVFDHVHSPGYLGWTIRLGKAQVRVIYPQNTPHSVYKDPYSLCLSFYIPEGHTMVVQVCTTFVARTLDRIIFDLGCKRLDPVALQYKPADYGPQLLGLDRDPIWTCVLFDVHQDSILRPVHPYAAATENSIYLSVPPITCCQYTDLEQYAVPSGIRIPNLHSDPLALMGSSDVRGTVIPIGDAIRLCPGCGYRPCKCARFSFRGAHSGCTDRDSYSEWVRSRTHIPRRTYDLASHQWVEQGEAEDVGCVCNQGKMQLSGCKPGCTNKQ